MAKRPPASWLDPDPDGYVVLSHYTCPQSAAIIRRQGVIVPAPQPQLRGLSVVWLANYQIRAPGGEHPSRVLGFPWPRGPKDCDKTSAQIKVRIPFKRVEWWPDVKGEFAEAWEMSRRHRSAKPWHWWLTTEPIKLEVRK